MPLTLNAWHSPEHQAWHPRQLITIANDSDQGEQGPATYTVED